MHPHIATLCDISSKPQRTIVGLMSGTSMDGLDVALCKITGAGPDTHIEVTHFETCSYPDEYQQYVREIFAKRDIDLQHLTLLNAWIGKLHGELVNQCLAKWQVPVSAVDAIASHGQTVYHCPQKQHGLAEFPNATLQIGDGCHVAVTTGVMTLSDFRQKHIAAGGEGAPLAAYGDYLYFADKTEHRVLLNIGGIANITVLPKGASMQQAMCADLGPGNTMIDAYIQQHFAPLQYDKDSEKAKQGTVNSPLLSSLMAHSFLSLGMPKTTGPEVFNLAYLQTCIDSSGVARLSHEDILATLTEFSASCIAKQLNALANDFGEIGVYVSGGGLHNPLLIERIRALSAKGITLSSLSELGIDPDAKEAVLFALLANETLAGNAADKVDNSGSMPAVTMGKFSFPD
ncbi:anhydro-N-acetylmuramic acid kinase [Pseudoalteromonas sp. YIC-656]|uniref:anhydro-N-acetylmuramic acid kinase n=1 Tax=Pseudoalteromonas pernae TaxID=3118054 RepID=UPI003242B5A5